MTDLNEIKRIIAHEFRVELSKTRSSAISNEIGNFATQLEIEIQKKLKKLENGIPIDEIIPKTAVID